MAVYNRHFHGKLDQGPKTSGDVAIGTDYSFFICVSLQLFEQAICEAER
jgi:hypothetical protein